MDRKLLASLKCMALLDRRSGSRHIMRCPYAYSGTLPGNPLCTQSELKFSRCFSLEEVQVQNASLFQASLKMCFQCQSL